MRQKNKKILQLLYLTLKRNCSQAKPLPNVCKKLLKNIIQTTIKTINKIQKKSPQFLFNQNKNAFLNRYNKSNYFLLD